MKFKIVKRTNLEDGSLRILLEMAQSDLIYMGFILESFEGWCIYTTPIKKEPFLQLDVPPDFISNIEELLEFLESWDNSQLFPDIKRKMTEPGTGKQLKNVFYPTIK